MSMMRSTNQTIRVGALVEVQPWKDGDRLPETLGIIVCDWTGKEESWIVWFFGQQDGQFVPGETAQGYQTKELAGNVVGTYRTLDGTARNRMERALLARGDADYAELLGLLYLHRNGS